MRNREGRWDPRLIVFWQSPPRISCISRICRFRDVEGLIRCAAIECVAVVERLEPWLVVARHPYARHARWSFGPIPLVGLLPDRWKIRPIILSGGSGAL